MNKKITTAITDTHLTPSCCKKGLKDTSVTGNTVVDAQLKVVQTIHGKPKLRKLLHELFPFLNSFKKLVIAFKADIDDLRESPALAIVRLLTNMNCGQILTIEPFISNLQHTLSESNIALNSLDSALQQANIIALPVDHKQFKTIDNQLLPT